jgi:glycosyltransferase involved in cell wall biosynthesis
MKLAGLRVALVGPLPPPAGGMANQTRQLAELLAGEGAHVELVQVNAPYRPAWIGRVPWVRAGFRLAPYLARLWRAAGRADLFHVMANSGWSWHLFAAPAVWIASLRGVPAVVNYRGGEAGDFLRRSARSVRATLARAAALAVPSAFLQRVFAEQGVDSRVLPNVVDLARFHPAENRARRDADAPHLLVARNLEPIYDVGTAIRAFAAVRATLPRARLSVAGSGPELDVLRALARDLGIEGAVAFTGRLDRDEMAALYPAADVVLNPSRVDNLPNSILEALASGVPVVSTDVGGVPFVVAHGKTALLVPAGDDRAMAEAALAVLRDGRLRADLVAAGLAEVQRYAWARVRDVLAALYADCLAGRSAAAPVT